MRLDHLLSKETKSVEEYSADVSLEEYPESLCERCEVELDFRFLYGLLVISLCNLTRE